MKVSYLKLIDARYAPISIVANRTIVKNGKELFVRDNVPKRFIPNKKYEVPEDKETLKSLLAKTETINYDPKFEEELKKCGANYEVKVCKVCGGRVKRIEYHVLEVVDDE